MTVLINFFPSEIVGSVRRVPGNYTDEFPGDDFICKEKPLLVGSMEHWGIEASIETSGTQLTCPLRRVQTVVPQERV